jgi:hypothetical protein
LFSFLSELVPGEVVCKEVDPSQVIMSHGTKNKSLPDMSIEFCDNAPSPFERYAEIFAFTSIVMVLVTLVISSVDIILSGNKIYQKLIWLLLLWIFIYLHAYLCFIGIVAYYLLGRKK